MAAVEQTFDEHASIVYTWHYADRHHCIEVTARYRERRASLRDQSLLQKDLNLAHMGSDQLCFEYLAWVENALTPPAALVKQSPDWPYCSAARMGHSGCGHTSP